jgi:long-subunit acyl-CoA synthetase (AMP-forming)
MFALSPYVAQSMVYGDSLKACVIAIIVPDMSKLKQWAADNGKKFKLTKFRQKR